MAGLARSLERASPLPNRERDRRAAGSAGSHARGCGLMTKPIRVLVADDHMIVRTGIRHVLESEPGFEVVGEAANGADALALAAELLPDVVVLDISMPDVSGLELAARLRDTGGTRVLILSMHNNAEYVLESVRAGAHGYLLKDTAATELRTAMKKGVLVASVALFGGFAALVAGNHSNVPSRSRHGHVRP